MCPTGDRPTGANGGYFVGLRKNNEDWMWADHKGPGLYNPLQDLPWNGNQDFERGTAGAIFWNDNKGQYLMDQTNENWKKKAICRKLNC